MDGANSALDADKLDGFQASDFPRTAAQVRDRVRQVDGPGSDINADKLDGFDSTDFVRTAEQLKLARLTRGEYPEPEGPPPTSEGTDHE